MYIEIRLDKPYTSWGSSVMTLTLQFLPSTALKCKEIKTSSYGSTNMWWIGYTKILLMESADIRGCFTLNHSWQICLPFYFDAGTSLLESTVVHTAPMWNQWLDEVTFWWWNPIEWGCSDSKIFVILAISCWSSHWPEDPPWNAE